MEQEIEESLISTIPSLKSLCIKNIDKKSRENSFFIINEGERLKEKLRGLNPQEDSNTEEMIDEIVRSYHASHGAQEDPPFFHLKNGNKDIYILGSPHTVPMIECLSLPSLLEIRRISTLNPIFYIEHEITNQLAFPLLKDPNNQVPQIVLKTRFDPLSMADKTSPLKSIFLKCSAGSCFFSKMGELSDVELKEAEKVNAWLSAVLLGVHANILSFQQFGGLEYELMQQSCWKEIRFLEENDEVLRIQERFAKDDSQHNLMWIRKSMMTIINFITCDEDTLEKITINMWKQLMDTYSYHIIDFSAEGCTTKSGIARNENWAENLANIVNDEHDDSPLFLVIGNTHLVGYDEGKSFLSFLLAKCNFNHSLSRFSNTQNIWAPLGEI